MKKLVVIAATILTTAAGAQADQHNGLGGLILGAGGGALAGQAIGRDTKATVIGTAVGSVIGYIVGSEMDSDQRGMRQTSHRYDQPVVYEQEKLTTYSYEPAYGHRPAYSHEPAYEHRPAYSYEPAYGRRPAYRDCRQSEILGTINGKARKIYGTVCRTPQGWELVSEDPYDYKPTPSHYKKRAHRHDNGNHYGHQKQHWVRHRY